LPRGHSDSPGEHRSRIGGYEPEIIPAVASFVITHRGICKPHVLGRGAATISGRHGRRSSRPIIGPDYRLRGRQRGKAGDDVMTVRTRSNLRSELQVEMSCGSRAGLPSVRLDLDLKTALGKIDIAAERIDPGTERHRGRD